MTHATPITHPIPWIRTIASELGNLNDIPLFGNAPSFDWDQFSMALSQSFGIAGLKVTPKGQKWCSDEEWGDGLGPNPIVSPIVITPLSTPLFLATSQKDREKLTHFFLGNQGNDCSFSSEVLQEGYYRFLILQALDSVQSLDLFKEMTLQLGEEATLPDGKFFCIDLFIHLEDKKCWSRLIIPATLKKNWVEYFSAFPSEYSPTPLSKKLELTIGIKAGSILLTQKEWKKIREGDFILLDQSNYEPFSHSGSVMLMLHSKPLFEAKMKQNKIQLTRYAFIQEDPMQESKKPEPHALEAAEEEAMAIKDLPLHVSVELSRVKMTLDQLMGLSPGNILELPVLPEENVSLVVNGQKVARGELIYLGEMLGVRIIEMG